MVLVFVNAAIDQPVNPFITQQLLRPRCTPYTVKYRAWPRQTKIIIDVKNYQQKKT